MNKQNFNEFLSGVADDNQQRVCEELLANPETIVNVELTVGDDSLLKALQMADSQSGNRPELQTLVEQMEKLVPRHSITADELNRFLDPSENPEDLGRIGRFRVIEFLASGGMGLVFRAVDPGLKRSICIKLLSPNLEFNAEAISRFERESREVARLGSERIVTVLEVGRQQGLPFFVMPMLEGMSLRTLLDRDELVSTDRAIQITRQLAEGLQYAHERHLLHRDIKPDNLWLTTNGDVVILDFGLARSTTEPDINEPPITRQGTVIGTPSYMSPEQVTGKELDERSDLFSVGVVLVEMLTGVSPFKRANLFTTMMSVAGEELQLDQLEQMQDIPLGLRQLTQRLLRKNPDERIASASALIESLDKIEAAPNSPLGSTQSAGSIGGSWSKVIAAGFSGAVLSLVTMLIWFANDKGTLVVSTNDPNVEVKIGKDTVRIYDPISKRDFEVRIGETPLPSGVYQLESQIGKDGLVFSSQTIAIRRGEKTIVTVELVENEERTATSDPGVLPTTNKPWADLTRVSDAYNETTRDALIEQVRSLPSLSIADTGFDPSPALSHQARVQTPSPVEGIDAWTIERLNDVAMKFEFNCDGTLFAGFQESEGSGADFVRILDSEGNVKSALPVPGTFSSIQWCEHANDLVAVSSWCSDLGAASPNKYLITIWQVSKTGVRLISKMQASSRSFNWDSGYRIICFVDEKLSAIRIHDGLHWTVPEAAGQEYLYDDAVSPDGRYVVTYSVPAKNAQLSVWDLKTGEFKLAIPSGIRFQWGRDSENLAVHTRRLFEFGRAEEQAIEMWNIPSTRVTSSFPQSTTNARSKILTSISPDLKTIVLLYKKSQVTLTDAATRRERSITPPDSFLKKAGGSFSIRWVAENELEFFQDENVITWTRGVAGLSGEFGELSLKAKVKLPQPSDFRIVDFRLSANGDLSLMGTKTSDNKEAAAEAFGLTLDMASNTIRQSTSFSTEQWKESNYGRRRLGFVLPGTSSSSELISPNGNFALIWGASTLDRGSASRNLRVVDLSNPDRMLPIMNLEWIKDIAWSKDESLLIVSGREWYSRGSRDTSKVIDLKNWEERVVEGIPLEQVNRFVEWNNGFVCEIVKVLKRDPRTYQHKIGYFALEGDSKFQTVNQEFNWIGFFEFQGPNIVWIGRPFNETEQHESRDSETRKQPLAFLLSPDLKLVEASEFKNDRFKSIWSQSYSFDGKFFAEKTRIEDSLDSEFSVSTGSGNDDPNSNQALAKFKGSEFQWHPNYNSAIWWDRSERMFILDAESKSEPKIVGLKPIKTVPVSDGWLVASDRVIQHFGFDGYLVAELSLEKDAVGNLSKPVWLYADGSMSGATERLHFVYQAGSEFHAERLNEVQKLFPSFKLNSKQKKLELPKR